MTPGFVPAPGATVHIVNEFGTEHMHIVVAGPDADGRIALVSISSDRQTKRTDRACFLEAGAHHFVRHRSYVFYAGAVILNCDAVRRGIAAGEMRLELACSEELTERVVAGVLTSPRTPRGVRDFVKDAQEDS